MACIQLSVFLPKPRFVNLSSAARYAHGAELLRYGKENPERLWNWRELSPAANDHQPPTDAGIVIPTPQAEESAFLSAHPNPSIGHLLIGFLQSDFPNPFRVPFVPFVFRFALRSLRALCDLCGSSFSGARPECPASPGALGG